MLFGSIGHTASVAVDSAIIGRTARFDSSEITKAEVNQEKLNAYFNDPELNYEQQVTQWPPFLSAILARILDFISPFFTKPKFQPFRSGLYYILVAAVILLVFYAIRKSYVSKTWGKSESDSITISTVNEDIHQLNLEELLEQAVQKKEYRRAVRLGFLKVLRQMTDKGAIRWRQEKTNRDYQQEVADANYAGDFDALIRFYEYIWYGNFPVDSSTFTKIREQMKLMEHKIGKDA